MPKMTLERSLVLVVDFQSRLMPAISEGEARMASARKLLAAARLLGAPVVATEQNPRGLGTTVEGLLEPGERIVSKMTFSAVPAQDFSAAVPTDRDIVLMGAETHVCVLQTALDLRARGQRVCVVEDAVGSRRESDRQAGLARMAGDGAEIVTSEMVIFEWLRNCEHSRFREAIRLVR